MMTNSLRRWSRPKIILVVSDLSENPAHTLRVIGGVRTTGAKVVLVQLPYPAFAAWRVGQDRQAAVPPSISVNYRSTRATDQAFLWAEILSEVTVLRNTPIERIPALADSLGADMVVLTTPEMGRILFSHGNARDIDLFGSLKVPIMICGWRSEMSSWNARSIRKILVPIVFRPLLEVQMRLACRFARRHHGRITVLHVFESGEPASQPWDRTSVAVEEKLPIGELKQEGILPPLEIAVCEGYPERKILAFNEQNPHDLIVMGGPSKRGSINALGRGVTETVITDARCPVLVLGGAIMPVSAGSVQSNSFLTLTQNDNRKDHHAGG